MDTTPKGNRLHIALLGRTNVGKSSFLNLVVGQDIAITSSVAGTTTDVVEKAMELLPLGPVLFLDTAGLDDASELSALRLKKTEKIFDRADIALLVTEPDVWGTYEEEVLAEMDKRRVPVIVVVNKIDLHRPSDSFLQNLKAKVSHVIPVSSLDTADEMPSWTP